MCKKYLNKELIAICSYDIDRDDCGNACDHCPYSGNYDLDEDEKQILKEEENKICIYNFFQAVYLDADINKILSKDNIEIRAEYRGSKVICIKMLGTSLWLNFGYNDKGIITYITLA